MSESKPNINSWLEEELYQQYLHDRRAVDDSWKHIFEEDGGKKNGGNGASAPVRSVAVAAPAAAPVPAVDRKPSAPVEAGPAEQMIPLRGAAARIADNMTASLAIPVATSVRAVPVKVIDENRRILNQQRTLQGKGKISYTHIIGWAIVQAVRDVPSINHAYVESDGEPYRVARTQLNLGIAVDVAGKDGTRSLLVPNIKNAGTLNFAQYAEAFDDVVKRARTGKLQVQDFQGTTVSLTNPGTVGTIASVPRLMPGQGAIIATGAIDFPAEYQGVSDEMRTLLGLSKVMNVTCTYDHRVIQGAESGAFLGRLQALLQGEDEFYDRLFADLRMPYHPVKWEPDRHTSLPGTASASRTAEIAKEAAVLQLINAYRVRGHLIADLDPLGSEPSYHPELDPATYGLSIWDLDREFLMGNLGQQIGEGAPPLERASLRQILETLRQTYCARVGCEYMNIQVPEQKRWLQGRMEPTANNWPLERSTQVRVLERLLEAEGFEHFLHARFVGHKRFSLEGGEAAMAILDELLERASASQVHEIVIGMAHRGRLTVLANLVGKAMTQIFSEFEGNVDPDSTQGSGDVKYHLGATGVRRTASGAEITVSVSPNPSHLEAVDPVVEGIVRPKQDRLGDKKRARVIPLLVHGDAAFAGQGVVAETLNLSQLEGYTTGGTIHLIINNQIGFTTQPEEGRSTPYSTDVARMVQAPIFHVNGDDPEACIRVAQLAFDFRQTFNKDVVIDMICYRRHGHNEGDDPSYTQPILYRKIKQQPSVATQYREKLTRDGVVTPADLERIQKGVQQTLTEAYDAAQKKAERFEVSDLSGVDEESISAPFCTHTAATREELERVVAGITRFPDDFNVHPKLRNFVDKRKQLFEGIPVDWAFGEALAFGSLVLEGTPVRLSGQDSGRGTFSQRHLEFYDYDNGRLYIPLKHLDPAQARFEVVDSSLSEYAVMGFEFGYSIGDPLTLVMWEAQFGDFVNGAQIMIDQFISASESKWGQPSGLVLLLPHGYEGQGPEHSSARIERFLQLCAENNMQVCNASTPAQYFHLLRRQMYGGADRRGMRKPLIIFTPKSLLRHPKAVSRWQDLTSGGFREVIGDEHPLLRPDHIAKVLMCSGKVYYDLIQAREERGLDNVAIVRLEQMYPFPLADLRDVLARYPVSAELVWVQEESKNMGPWRFVREWMEPVLEEQRRPLRYAGRAESASPSAGSLKRHTEEQADLIEQALTGAAPQRTRRRVVPRRRK
ncbi:MAG: multifunctional oxoglutarate decarboxylase/oxoglutarate dehydrogenase thiamine pyrophosphate-binding subunit/dihydrolipoyllysine-residue succinyltransferase subunit [Bryobacteraceae bacterium]|nr:multifunctional oxoglutarate decarboxylase/oxoglutarate dehydrogenase thiamine pyrophosphate-binding subunit/dihydrolipoyllysine-residue succinyltransferase subunit [Bryobacteraceae bacterium]